MVPDLRLVDETYDTNITSSYFLSIQVNLDGFSFSTLDPVRNKYIQFKYFSFGKVNSDELPVLAEKIFEQNELLNLPYKKVFVLLPSPYSTLVPSGLFEEKEAGKWLSFTHQLPPEQKIVHSIMKMADAWNIFAAPKEMVDLFRRQFPDPRFFHQYVPMAETRLAVSRPGAGRNQAIINLQKKYFDLVVLEKNNLKLCNSFEISSEEDLIYYTLFVFEQLQLSPSGIEVQLIGSHPDFNKIKQTLGKYIKHVKQPGLPGGFQYSYLFKEVSGHKFHNLLSMASCV
ncbi:DUF3822 family protein [Marinilabilia rubra]|uniref:DUF3822 domain-containing protein n=1 Tax=Marinilabilia rubra TaxID=2162893 RepID=A0A2U2B6J4_9BACT|nr:DUF3822 family protein [Marinilabilia rubra]PWD98700.1 DUF3822 domain-containing protein [Marinilabilia rubra]